MYTLYVFAARSRSTSSSRAQLRTHRALGVRRCRRGLLLPAMHPYGAIVVAAEAAVALWLWRGRPLPSGLPDARGRRAADPVRRRRPAPRRPLRRRPGRRGVDRRAERRLGPTRARFLGDGRRRTGSGPASSSPPCDRAGTARPSGTGRSSRSACSFLLRRRCCYSVLAHRAHGALAAAPRLRVPLVGALIGVAVARAVQGRGELARAGAVALDRRGRRRLSPFGGIRDPRDWQNDVLGGGPAETAPGAVSALAAPADWLRDNVEEGDLLFPFSAVFWPACPRPASRFAPVLADEAPRARGRPDRASGRTVVVCVPSATGPSTASAWTSCSARASTVHDFAGWLLVEGRGRTRTSRCAPA